MRTRSTQVDQLVAGVWFIPEGKKRPVQIFMMSDVRGPTVDVYASSPSGNSAHILNRYDTVEVVVREDAPREASGVFDSMDDAVSRFTDYTDRLVTTDHSEGGI